MKNKTLASLAVLSLIVVSMKVYGEDKDSSKTSKSKKAVNAKQTSSSKNKTVKVTAIQKSNPSSINSKKISAGLVETSNPGSAGGSLIPADSAGKTSTTVTQSATKAKKSKFGIKWISYNALDVQAAESYSKEVDGEVRGWEQINLNYKPTDKITLSVMPQIGHTWFGAEAGRSYVPGMKYGPKGIEQPYSFYFMNTALKVTHAELANFGGFVWDGQLRYDIPTSEFSQKSGELGQTWITTGIAKSVGKFDFKVYTIGRFYIQQYNTSTVLEDNKAGLPTQTTRYRIYSLADVGYNFSKKFITTLEGGMMNVVKNADVTTGRPEVLQDRLLMILDLTYVMSSNLSLSLGVSDDYNMRKLDDPIPHSYIPFDAYNGGEFYLQATISI